MHGEDDTDCYGQHRLIVCGVQKALLDDTQTAQGGRGARDNLDNAVSVWGRRIVILGRRSNFAFAATGKG